MSDGSMRPWTALILVGLAELLGMSLWFAASAISTELQTFWELDSTQGVLLTTFVQIGFVAGTAFAAVLNLADILPARWYFAGSAALGAAVNAALLMAPGFKSALALRFSTGFLLAGVYPPAMKMVATWFRSGRGLAIGVVVGALTVGMAVPFLIRSLGGASFQAVILVSTSCALLGAVIVGLGYRDGPNRFEQRRFSWWLSGLVFRHTETRLVTIGYLGHSWEIYAMWTWIPAFLAASTRAHGAELPDVIRITDVLSFCSIAAGGLGCLLGGWAADRVGRERVVSSAMAASGLCSLIVGFLFGLNPWVVGALTSIWGFFVVADSAQFSALVTEVAPPHAVGTALTLQTSLGFLLTVVTIQLVPLIQAATGWRWAFAFLALGPAVGIAAIRRLASGRSVRKPDHPA